QIMKRPLIYASPLASAVAVAGVGLIARTEKTAQGISASAQQNQDWPAYGGAPENNHYSNLAQISRENVKHLAIACTFDTQEEGGIQTSSIIIKRVLCGSTP